MWPCGRSIQFVVTSHPAKTNHLGSSGRTMNCPAIFRRFIHSICGNRAVLRPIARHQDQISSTWSSSSKTEAPFFLILVVCADPGLSSSSSSRSSLNWGIHIFSKQSVLLFCVKVDKSKFYLFIWINWKNSKKKFTKIYCKFNYSN